MPGMPAAPATRVRVRENRLVSTASMVHILEECGVFGKPRRVHQMNHAYPDRPVVGLLIGVSGAIITGSTMNPPQCQWRHSARASRLGSRDPRSHVARRLQRPLDGSGLRCWRSSQSSSLRDGFGWLPVCSGGHTLCVRTRRGSIVRANRTSRDYQLVRIVLKRRRRV